MTKRDVLLAPAERAFAEAISTLALLNPFEAEQVAAVEKRAAAIDLELEAGSARMTKRIPERAQIAPLLSRTERLLDQVRRRLRTVSPRDDELLLYQDLYRWIIYFVYRDELQASVETPGRSADYYSRFTEDLRHYIDVVPAPRRSPMDEPAHLFACFFQIRRAFHHIHAHIIGKARPVARLRAAVWYSIFTCDSRRYGRLFFDRMHDLSTLITGPSGTGKELVARAIGLSRYLEFQPRTRTFGEVFADAFHSVNIAALASTLIESELFGHRKGAFTGAVEDRAGWFEVCKFSHAVFLDEIGELEPALQVKLLTVLQDRRFHRLGDTQVRRFEGKVIAATNRDLCAEMRGGRFRPDLYYRLCSDLITTPSLQEQLTDEPGDLEDLVRFILRRVVGDSKRRCADDAEQWIERFTHEVVVWIDGHLGKAYSWPGNIRELEQCVRNLLVRNRYQPLDPRPDSPRDRLLAQVRGGRLTQEALLSHYCSMLYAETDSIEEVARRLDVDRRTVKNRLNAELVAAYRALDVALVDVAACAGSHRVQDRRGGTDDRARPG